MPIELFKLVEINSLPSGRLAICRLPGRTGDLDADVAEIARWAPDIVVSMTETSEMAASGAAGLIEALRARSIKHAHFPIRDFGTPEAGDERWPALSERLHAVLDRGGSILLHCMGGLGRSGMVALRLLIERGLPPAQALAEIRAARPGAVETDAQEIWGKDIRTMKVGAAPAGTAGNAR